MFLPFFFPVRRILSGSFSHRNQGPKDKWMLHSYRLKSPLRHVVFHSEVYRKNDLSKISNTVSSFSFNDLLLLFLLFDKETKYLWLQNVGGKFDVAFFIFHYSHTICTPRYIDRDQLMMNMKAGCSPNNSFIHVGEQTSEDFSLFKMHLSSAMKTPGTVLKYSTKLTTDKQKYKVNLSCAVVSKKYEVCKKI